MVATPITPGDVLYAAVLWIALRGDARRAVFLLVAALLGACRRRGACSRSRPRCCARPRSARRSPRTRSTQESDLSFPVIMRLGVLPLFLFSGTFFPISPAARLAAAARARSRRCGTASSSRAPRRPGTFDAGPDRRARRGARRVHRRRAVRGACARFTRTVDRDATSRMLPLAARRTGRGGWSSATCSRTGASGTSSSPASLEPLLFLLSIGVGVGALVGDDAGRRPAGRRTTQFVAPGLLASAAMNGALLDTTFNFFFKYQVRAHLRRGARDAARRRRRRGRRDRVGADARRDLLGRVPR